MENRHPNSVAWPGAHAWRQQQQQQDNDDDRFEDSEYNAQEAARCGKRHRGGGGGAAQYDNSANGSSALWGSFVDMQCKPSASEKWGCANNVDPLTGLELDTARPVALLVNEQTGQLTGFDLFSLHKMFLRKGKLWIRTFEGRYKLDWREAEALRRDFLNYYGIE